MSNQTIQVVAGDRGGWNAMKPVLVTAADQGYKIETIFVGVCAEQYSDKRLELDSRFNVKINPSADDIKNEVSNDVTKAVVLGMSQSKEGLEAITTAALSTSAPVFGIQDYYGSAVPLLRSIKKEGKLDVIKTLCVNDEIAKQQIIEKGFALNNLVTTGSPHFDQIIPIKHQWEDHRRKLRNLLQVDDQEIVFLVVGQPNGTAEILNLLEQSISLASLQEQASILVRMHPRATPENIASMEKHYQSTSYKRFLSLPVDISLTTDDLLPAADFVLSGYSTTNHIAVLYEMPGVIYVKTPLIQEDLISDTGLSKPTEVEAGAAWYSTTSQELAYAIKAVSLKESSQENRKINGNQQIIARYNDGHATERCWEELKKL